MRYGGRKLAPINVARWAAESTAPFLRRDSVHFPLFFRNGTFEDLATQVKSVSADITPIGPAIFNQETNDSNQGLEIPAPRAVRSGISDLTFVAWIRPNATTQTAFVYAHTTSNNDGARMLRSGGAGDAWRWRLPEAAGNVDISNGGFYSAGDVLQMVGRLGGGNQTFTIYNATTDDEKQNSASTSASISFSNNNAYLFTNEAFSASSFGGDIIYGALYFWRWSDDDIAANRIDPFAAYRRRPLLVPVSSGGGATTVTVGQATETDTAFAVSAAKAQSIGQATETDTAQSVTAVRTHAVGQATETDAAQPIGASKAKAVGQATETDIAFAVTPVRTYSIGQATETDTANSLTHSKSVTVGQAQETDEAFPVTVAGGATAKGTGAGGRLFMKNVDRLMDY